MGDETSLERLMRQCYEDRLDFIRTALDRGTEEIAKLEKGDGGAALAKAEVYIHQAVDLSKEALGRLKELTSGRKSLDDYLRKASANLENLRAPYLSQVKSHYEMTAALKGFKPETAKADPVIAELKKIRPAKAKPIAVGDMMPYMRIGSAFQKDPEMMMETNRKYGFEYSMRLFKAIDGKKNLEQIRQILSFEFVPVEPADILKHIKAMETAKLVTLNSI